MHIPLTYGRNREVSIAFFTTELDFVYHIIKFITNKTFMIWKQQPGFQQFSQ